jgi:wyosine [tRNA(Phe)-imidazoG37] synthetase (radical SAM superfamily)
LHETVPLERVLNDLDKALKRIDLNSLDIVTFSGAGEPTLNPDLKAIASSVKERIGGLPMAILTNASLFHRKDVRRALREFDMVVTKLDAGDNEAFHSINRPRSRELSIKTIINSIKKVGVELEGRLALEIMLLESDREQTTNVQGRHLQRLAEVVLEIEPEIVQLLVPYRPPSESFVRVPTPQSLNFISEEFSNMLGEERLWVYSLHDRRGKTVRRLPPECPEEEVIELLKRRPCRVIDISSSLAITLSDTQRLLEKLGEEHLIVSEMRGEENYYSCRD